MEINKLCKPAPFFFLESWLLNIYACISVILNHKYLVTDSIKDIEYFQPGWFS